MISSSSSLTENYNIKHILLSLFVVLYCGSILIQPFYTFSISVFIYLIYLFFNRTHFGAIVFIFSYPIINRVFLLIFGENLPYMGYYPYILILMVLIYGSIFFQKKVNLSFTRLDFLMMFFFLTLLISIFFRSSNQAYGLEKFQYLFFSIILFYLPAIFFNYVDRGIKYFEAILIFGILVTVFGYFEIFGLNKLFFGYYGGRLSVLGLNPIWVSRYLSYAILVEIYFLLKYTKNFSQNIGKVIVLSLAIIVQLNLVISSGSRGPILGLIMAVAVMLIIRFRIKAVIVLTIMLIVLILFSGSFVIFPQEMTSRILTAEDTGKITAGVRILSNIQAIQYFWDNKIFGIGFGSYTIGGDIFETLRYPHNIFTEILAETGLIGFLLFMTIIIMILKVFFTNWRNIDLNLRLLIIGFMISSTVNASLSGHIGGNSYFWFSLGMAYFTSLYSSRNVRIEL